jgi:hypothetical protein
MLLNRFAESHHNLRQALIRILAIPFISFPLIADAAQFYRWIDEQGNTNINSHIPPEFVKNGYEVIDDKGNLIKVVAPEISEEERRTREENRINSEMQQARDNELLKLYRSPDDVDRAMKTWLSRMDMEIRVKESRIRIKESEFDKLQSRAANLEKSGRKVDDDILQQMEAIKLEIDRFSKEINEVQSRQDASRSVFMEDRARMVELWEIRNKKPWEDETPP